MNAIRSPACAGGKIFPVAATADGRKRGGRRCTRGWMAGLELVGYCAKCRSIGGCSRILRRLWGHLAAESILDQDRRGRVKLIFWLMFAVFVLATAWQQLRVAEADLVRDTRGTWADAIALRESRPNTTPPFFAYLDSTSAKAASSDVALRFIYPEEPALMIVNQSNLGARDIKWQVTLWNMDLPERNDPLPIPTSTFDWLRGHTEGGPQNLFGTPTVAPLLKSGNRLFGSATVDCPQCSRGRTYIVYIVLGKGGWLSEVKNETRGRILIPPNFLKETREKYFKFLEAAARPKMRTPIQLR